MKNPAEIVVADPESLLQCVADLESHGLIGFDSEFVGEETYEPELCLLQIATPDTLYLIDPYSAGPLDAFWRVMVDPARLVVVHAGREEIRMCRRHAGRTPNVCDLQIAAALIGLTYPIGHATLVQVMFGKTISKAETLTEWRSRPLTADQQQYAFNDVRFLLGLWARIEKRLKELGRTEWLVEECARFCEQQSLDQPGQPANPDKWRKLRGAGSLDRKRLAVVRELFLAREELAAEANRPPRVILRDDLLIEIAKRNPKSAADLQTIRGLGLGKRYLNVIWEATVKARSLPPTSWPDLIDRDQDPVQVGLIANVLNAWLGDHCHRQHLASNLVASMGDLKEIIRCQIEKQPLPDSLPLGRGWRREFALAKLLTLLEGKASLRIADVASESPFACDDLP
jgi:ribonuclease D